MRAVALRSDLERLGRFDPVRVRQRILSAFDPALTTIVLVDGREVGCIAVRPDAGSLWIEHFYLAPTSKAGESARRCFDGNWPITDVSAHSG